MTTNQSSLNDLLGMMSTLQFSPGGFKAKTAEPEATLEIFDKYEIQMQRVFRLNRRTNPVTGDRVDFTDGEKKDIMLLEGGVDMEDLFKHVGKVQEDDSYAQAVNKIREALKKRGSRSAAVYKLFSKNPQGSTSFDEWHRVVYEGAKRIDWTGYGPETAAVDAICKPLVRNFGRRLSRKAQIIKRWLSLVLDRSKLDLRPGLCQRARLQKRRGPCRRRCGS